MTDDQLLASVPAEVQARQKVEEIVELSDVIPDDKRSLAAVIANLKEIFPSDTKLEDITVSILYYYETSSAYFSTFRDETDQERIERIKNYLVTQKKLEEKMKKSDEKEYEEFLRLQKKFGEKAIKR